MFESSLYGLSNPPLYKDVGEAMMEQQLGLNTQVQDPYYSLPNGTNLSEPPKDTVTLSSDEKKDSKKSDSKKSNWIKGGALAVGAIALLALGLKFGSSLLGMIKKVFKK